MVESITWQDFQNVDIRVGTIVRVEDFPEARNPAYKLWIDVGELGEKCSSAQITHLYDKEKLTGRQVICVTNFPKKQIANFFSEVLVVGFMNEEKQVVLAVPDQKVANGSRLM